MAASAFVYKLLPVARGTLCRTLACPTRTAVRAFSCTACRSQLQRVKGTGALTGKVDRFGGVTVNLKDSGLPEDVSESSFSGLLKGECRRQDRSEGEQQVIDPLYEG